MNDGLPQRLSAFPGPQPGEADIIYDEKEVVPKEPEQRDALEILPKINCVVKGPES